MKNSLTDSLRDSFSKRQAEPPPTFAVTWQAATERHKAGQARYRRLAAVAASAATAVLALNLWTAPPDTGAFIEIADLLESTSWAAPSDVLLPEYEFDIYQDMPMLIESTNSPGGSLL
jgi:hypothetical protein